MRKDWEDEFMSRFGGRGEVGRPVPQGKSIVIPDYSPHYTNDYFKTARIVWGKDTGGLSWDYSDRIWQWDYEKAENASKAASEEFSPRTAAWVEKYLSVYFEKDIEIVCIMAGFNVSNGYPYQVFGYRERK